MIIEKYFRKRTVNADSPILSVVFFFPFLFIFCLDVELLMSRSTDDTAAWSSIVVITTTWLRERSSSISSLFCGSVCSRMKKSFQICYHCHNQYNYFPYSTHNKHKSFELNYHKNDLTLEITNWLSPLPCEFCLPSIVGFSGVSCVK